MARRRLADRPRRWSWGLDRCPLLWKEVHTQRGPAVRIGSGLLALAGAGGVLFILGLFAFTIPAVPWRELRLVMNIWMRVAGDLVVCLMLVQVAARAASSISGERDQQTLDTLLTTPQGSRNILFAKWLGSILCTWRSWLWLGVIWAVGWYTGALAAADIPGLFLACAVLALAVASMAIWVSSTSPTSSRALSNTFALILLVWVGHWGLMPLAEWQFNLSRWNLQWLWRLEAYTFTPPLAFDYLASRNYLIAEHWHSPYAGAELQEFDEISSYCWFGLAIWFSLSLALVCWAEVRFAATVGRRKPATPTGPPAENVKVVPELALAAEK